MFQPNQNPDDNLVVLFKLTAMPNAAKTTEAGRLVCDDVEVVEIRFPGSKQVSVFPATAMSHWKEDPYTGGQTMVTYAERFRRQYQQFKAEAVQTKSGTPLEYAPFLTEGRRAELRAQNVYIVEQLAAIEGAELKNLGPGGRDMKNAAMEFIEESKRGVPNQKMQAELEALRARNAILEEDAQRSKAKAEAEKPDSEFEAMSLPQLREYITAQSGEQPLGAMNRKTLIRMAENCQPKAA
jgi:hypothetical protein